MPRPTRHNRSDVSIDEIRRTPIDPNEIVVRRVPEQSFDRQLGLPTEGAFRAREDDAEGISFFRWSCHGPHQICTGFRTKGRRPVWIAAYRVDKLRELGMEVVPDPLPEAEGRPAQLGHALIANINSLTHQTKQGLELIAHLCDPNVCIRVRGPFPAPTEAK